MSRSIMSTLKIYKGGTTYLNWQNYYVNQDLSFLSATWEFFPFEIDGISESGALSGDGLVVRMPATNDAVSAFVAAQADPFRICEIKTYEFSAYAAQTSAPTAYNVLASSLGQVLDLGGSFTNLEATLGVALSPVGAQVPPRTYNSQLIGTPLRK